MNNFHKDSPAVIIHTKSIPFLRTYILHNQCKQFSRVVTQQSCYLIPELGTDYCDQGICICVCLCMPVFVCISVHSKHVQISLNFLCMLPCGSVSFLPYANAIHYVLPALWATLYLQIMEPMGQNQGQSFFVEFARSQ